LTEEQHRELSSVQSQLLLQDATLLLKIWLTERVAFNHPHQNNKMTFQVSTKNLSTGERGPSMHPVLYSSLGHVGGS